MKNSFIIIVVVLLVVIVFLSYKKSQDNKNAESLLIDKSENTDSTTDTTSGAIIKPSKIVTDSGFAKGDAVTVKSGSAMRRLSDPNIVDYQTTSIQTGWTIDKDLFNGSFKSGTTTKATGTWAIISKDVRGVPSWIPGQFTVVKLYQVVHTSRITKA